MEEERNQVGRPLKYHNAEEMQEAIDSYFSSCMIIKFQGDKPCKDRNGNYIFEFYRPPTMSGLAVALDIDRKTLLNYSKKDQFLPTIRRAKMKIEMFTEEKLFEKETCNGSKFSLSNNFGWAEKQEVKASLDKKLEDVL